VHTAAVAALAAAAALTTGVRVLFLLCGCVALSCVAWMIVALVLASPLSRATRPRAMLASRFPAPPRLVPTSGLLSSETPPPPSASRTKWTRLAHPSVLIGHVLQRLAQLQMDKPQRSSTHAGVSTGPMRPQPRSARRLASHLALILLAVCPVPHAPLHAGRDRSRGCGDSARGGVSCCRGILCADCLHLDATTHPAPYALTTQTRNRLSLHTRCCSSARSSLMRSLLT